MGGRAVVYLEELLLAKAPTEGVDGGLGDAESAEADIGDAG